MTKCNDATCPAFDHIDKKMTPGERKTLAAAWAGRGWTQQRIADALGVSQRQVSTYLDGLEVASKPPRPKGGRPAGRKNKPPKPHAKAAQIIAAVDQGKTDRAAAIEVGVSQRIVRRERNTEAVRRAAEALIDPATLSLTAQQKLDAAIRQHQRKLDLAQEARILAEVERRMDEVVLPAWKKRIDRAEVILKRDKGILTNAEYKLLRACLHPDRVQDADLKRKFERAFALLEKLIEFLCEPEKEPSAKFPSTWREAQSTAKEGERV